MHVNSARVSRDEFQRRLESEVEASARAAESRFHLSVPRPYAFAWGGTLSPLLDLAATVERLYLGDSEFFREIDLGVMQVLKDRTVIFIRPSGHSTGSWAQTWDPAGHGPFRLVEVETLVSPSKGLLMQAAEKIGRAFERGGKE